MGNTVNYNAIAMAADYIDRLYSLPINYFDYRSHPAAIFRLVELNLSEPQFHLFLVNGFRVYLRSLKNPFETEATSYLRLKVAVFIDLLLPVEEIPRTDKEAYDLVVKRLTHAIHTPGSGSALAADSIFPVGTQVLLQTLDKTLDDLNTESARIELEKLKVSSDDVNSAKLLESKLAETKPQPMPQLGAPHIVTPQPTRPETQHVFLGSGQDPADSSAFEPREGDGGEEARPEMSAPPGQKSPDHDLSLNDSLLASWKKSLMAKFSMQVMPNKQAKACASCNTTFYNREIAVCRNCSKQFCNSCCPIREYVFPDGHTGYNRYCDKCESIVCLSIGADVVSDP